MLSDIYIYKIINTSPWTMPGKLGVTPLRKTSTFLENKLQIQILCTNMSFDTEYRYQIPLN